MKKNSGLNIKSYGPLAIAFHDSEGTVGLVWWLVGTTAGEPRAVPIVYPIKQIIADTGPTL